LWKLIFKERETRKKKEKLYCENQVCDEWKARECRVTNRKEIKKGRRIGNIITSD